MTNYETQIMTFEYQATDHKFLMQHAMRAYRGGTLEEPFAETFVDAILPNLYHYIDTRANPEELLVSGTRLPMFKGVGNSTYEYKLSNESAECYYYLQDLFGKPWVPGFLINIYELRQETIEHRRAEEENGNGHLYKYPFNAKDWEEYKLTYYQTSYIHGQQLKEMNDGFVIDIHEPLETTIENFMRLKEKK